MNQSDAKLTQPAGNGFPYTYLPQGQIRLLTVSANPAGALTLSLTHHVYDSNLEYDALSYSWGRPDRAMCIVQCNEHSLRLSADLLEALENLAALKIARPIWIDYICINQPNKEDKAWQLKRMGQYYSQARQVWIWLGLPSCSDALAMSAMSDLATKLPSLKTTQPITDEWLEKSDLQRKNHSLWDGIDSLFTREWFNRLWTMQEFALATTATFVCGRQTAPGPDLVCVAENLLRLGLTSLTRKLRIPKVGYKDGYHFPTFAKRYWEAKTKNGSIGMELALQLGRLKEAERSSEHDRVYALLGLLDPEIADRIDCSDSMPYYKMYVDVGKLSLKTSSHLEILAQCQSRSRSPDLPSWCPDWSAENEAAPFYYDYYFAGFLPNTLESPHVEFPPGTNHLLIKGVCVTTVEKVANLWEKWDVEKKSTDGAREKFAYTLRWINECLEIARTSLGMPAPIVPEAFLRTLIADVLVSQTGHTDEQLQEMWVLAVNLMESLKGNKAVVPMGAREQMLAYTFLDSVFHACRFRRLFVTQDSRLALGPVQTKTGDKVVVFKNACMPFIVREMGDEKLYKLLGPAYVRGLMMGQVFGLVTSDQWEMFQIA